MTPQEFELLIRKIIKEFRPDIKPNEIEQMVSSIRKICRTESDIKGFVKGMLS